MRRPASLLAGGSLALLAIALGGGVVTAGGGCHARPATANTGAAPGADVAIAGCAFGPVILHVVPGSDVTWRNDDRGTHAVTGVGWGSVEELGHGDTASYRFNEPGIYPYQCYLHPGMSGAVVVGDAAGSAAGRPARAAGDTAAGAVAAAAPSDATSRESLETRPAGASPGSLGLAGGAAGVGLLLGLVIGRRKAARRSGDT
ncbi:MAG TPA: hypothetical protein VFK38_05480 [Candidatus Limnocylindrales bacterium]|nr:hypothetical protein [Candidatus Limnocylindrales bacterium]